MNLHSFFQHGHYEIRCCNASLHAGEVRAQIVLALAISNAAMTKKYCSPSVSHSDNMRYSFRVWLNVRFFNIQGTEDMMVDTLGMSVLSLPDLQYHFHGMDPNAVVNHAYNMLSYIFASGNPIKDNDTIDGIAGGQMSRDVQWRCHYEDALIQPPRPVIDICMNEYASGGREY